MSSSSIHRPRDRSGAGGSKALTPNSVSSKSSNSALKKSSSGKENSRLLTRSQKPAIRPVPRIEKAGGDNGDSRVRLSTSSAPRGRSPSPSQFIRVFNDLKGEKGSSASVERKGLKDVNVRGKVFGSNEKRRSSELKESSAVGVNLGKKSELEKSNSGVRVSGNRDVNSTSNMGKSSGIVGNVNNQNHKENVSSDCGPKVEKSVKVDILKSEKVTEYIGACGDLRSRESSEKSSSDSKYSGIIKNETSNAGITTKAGIKYPSKLHEKLSYLEGKVKRIASDIKRTKEMLDMNNTDASKVILSDIQDKISGIEKAMGNVVGDSDGKTSGSKMMGKDDGCTKSNGKNEDKNGDKRKETVKGIRTEELEARLFPHQKLIKNRTYVKASTSSQDQQSNVEGVSGDLKVDEKLIGPSEENLIASEFLASLDKGKTEITTAHGHADFECSEVQETDGAASSGEKGLSNMASGKDDDELILTSDERLDEFDDQENRQEMLGDETEDSSINQLNEIGQKTSTGGWFVSEGESVLLAHDDSSCSFYDIANFEEKAVYKPPEGVSPSMWRDCWIIRAPSADGCSGRYVVAASAGNTLDSGFCSWDFYTKDVRAFHVEGVGTSSSRTVLGPLPSTYRRSALSSLLVPENQQWWYRPCGPLIVSTASSQKAVNIYDIRDGELIMKWEVQKPVLTMDYSSPLQWRNRGKVVIAENETISLWDVNSLTPQALLSVSSSGRKISALHVNNTDAELGGGVRQRVTSAEAEGHDGVFCTSDSINILDFRQPSGIGFKIPKLSVNAQSVFSRGDSVFLGCSPLRSVSRKQSSSHIQQFSLRKQRLFNTYSLPETNAHPHHAAITQVWGNTNFVMAVSGNGLVVFDTLKDDAVQSLTSDHSSSSPKVREVIGPDDLYAPSFDYLASRVLLISRDRPAMWRHFS